MSYRLYAANLKLFTIEELVDEHERIFKALVQCHSARGVAAWNALDELCTAEIRKRQAHAMAIVALTEGVENGGEKKASQVSKKVAKKAAPVIFSSHDRGTEGSPSGDHRNRTTRRKRDQRADGQGPLEPDRQEVE